MNDLMRYGFCRWVKTARLQVWIGIAVFTVASYLMITGSYENLAERQRTEAILNAIGLVSLFYTAMAWYLNFFLRPRMSPTCERQ